MALIGKSSGQRDVGNQIPTLGKGAARVLDTELSNPLPNRTVKVPAKLPSQMNRVDSYRSRNLT